MSNGKHEWKTMKSYDGEYVNPVTGKTIRCRMHDVECAACASVVSLPDTQMPERVDGCLGVSARLKRVADPPPDFHKDEDYSDKKSGKQTSKKEGKHSSGNYAHA